MGGGGDGAGPHADGGQGGQTTSDAGPPVPGPTGVWTTTGDKSSLLARSAPLAFGTASTSDPYLDVDSTQTFQTVDGFGFMLTGGAATLIQGLAEADRGALLRELYGSVNAGSNAIGVSFLRVSIGASDMSASDFTYDDLASGQTDETLAHFSIAAENTALIPTLKAILALQPSIKILATPWTAPTWMKSNGAFIAGSLLTQDYDAYAQYFVKYVTAMASAGIPIYAVTPQNEPLNAGNEPSMTMSAAEETAFVGQSLGPAFRAAGLATKIIAYDEICDLPCFPLAVLGVGTASPFVEGSAFHLYAGDITALSTVHAAYPAKNVYFTEQYTASTGSFAGDLDWHLKNVVIGSMQNWGRTAIEWTLATDPSDGPRTPGGCTTCLGAVTLAPAITRNVGYYIIAHASKFVPPGSVRIGSTSTGSLNAAAFRTPAGQTVLVVENDGGDARFNVRAKGASAPASLVAGAVATYVW